MNMILNGALKALKKYGAEFQQHEDKWIFVNNGIWGLYDEGGVMVLDEGEVIELAEQYTDFKIG
jgi:hypothetical protein